MAMNKWVKKKWIKALKSGEYDKGKGRLASQRGDSWEYCCLGVLVCEMAPEFAREEGKVLFVGTEYNSSSYLPDDLAVMWGLDRNAQDVLSMKNDFDGTFCGVIAYIEDNL